MRYPRMLRCAFPMLLLLLLLPTSIGAQQRATPAQDWLTLSTENFDVHYPRQLETWTRDAAARLDAIHAAVSTMVGYTPSDRVTIVVDDPLATANGYAMPGPLIFLYPTPPDPRSAIGENRSWSEMLAVHEFAHVAHFDRPSRNSWFRLLRALLPAGLGPIGAAPRWVSEGYATFVEGELTGSGRPFGLWRPTVLRTFAAAGTLPRYSQINATEGFFAGSMAYLSGSAFLQWLVDEHGPDAMDRVWRRMTARTTRNFSSAFTGVFGADASELYARFTAELTAAAISVERAVDSAGRADGELFQRFSWYTGDPHVSANGGQMVIIRRSRTMPSQVLILSTAADTMSDSERRALERAASRDPEDVPAVHPDPRPHKVLARLRSPVGRSYDSPRFTADGERVLLTRIESVGEGSVAPDLFEWRWRENKLRRITVGAAVRHPDPSPDGRWAAATQCTGGYCSVVRINIDDGAVSVVASGDRDRSYYRPRISPDGRSILAAAQEGNLWRLFVIDAATGGVTRVDPDDGASRFDAEFSRDGDAVIAVSTAGGIFNLEIVDPQARTSRRITNVATGAFAPAFNASGDSAYFLALHARGFDVRKIATEGFAGSTDLPAAFTSFVTLRPPAAAPVFPANNLMRSRAYGAGPQRPYWMPHFSADADGASGGAILSLGDPVGRLSSVLIASAGAASSWRGARLASVWRGWPVALGAELQWSRRNFSSPQSNSSDLRFERSGAQIFAERHLPGIGSHASLAAGAWMGGSESVGGSRATRALLFASADADLVAQRGLLRTASALSATVETGRTGGESWTRLTARAAASIGTAESGLQLRAHAGWLNDRAPAGESFIAGGIPSPHLDARTSGNLIPAVLMPPTPLSGSRVLGARAELRGVFFVTPFAEWVVPQRVESGSAYHGGAGVTIPLNAPRLPQLAIPGLAGEIGAGTTIAGNAPRGVRFFMSLTVRP